MAEAHKPRIIDLAEQLKEANESGIEIEAPVKIKPDLTIQEAYSIQLYNIAERMKNGNKMVSVSSCSRPC